MDWSAAGAKRDRIKQKSANHEESSGGGDEDEKLFFFFFFFVFFFFFFFFFFILYFFFFFFFFFFFLSHLNFFFFFFFFSRGGTSGVFAFGALLLAVLDGQQQRLEGIQKSLVDQRNVLQHCGGALPDISNSMASL
jgi:hypothetical protein